MAKQAAAKSVFRESGVLSGLVTPQQIEEATDAIKQAGLQVDDERLAEHFVATEWLTAYQADQLKAGRTKLNLGPYTITDWIGQGGMGQVFKAVHSMMGRECAIKVLPLSKSTPEAIDNFTREIRTQAKLDHPNLVRAFDAGHDGNVHYLVTEYVPGTDLRQLVRRQGPLTMEQAAKVVLHAAHGLEHAHQRGLIHRDVKPGNILVTPEGEAKVSDLGLSGFIDEAEDDPRAGKIVGTADYLSPEQIKTPTNITSVSDIYSLGCTLYYAASGKVPFPGGTTRDKARRHCEETPWHPRRFNQDVSEEFVEIIADMMEKDPAERIQTAGEVAARLEPWAIGAVLSTSHHMVKSPWMPPPFPTGNEDDFLQDTDAGSEVSDIGDSKHGSTSQVSQATDPVASANQETKRMRAVTPPPLRRRGRDRTAQLRTLAIVLTITIPISMLIGALVTFLMMTWLH